MMKYKKAIALIAVMTVIVLTIGAVSAYMLKESVEVENVFVPAQVDCTVHETFDGTYKTDITVKSTSNVKAYIRLRVVSYWQDSKGSAVARKSEMPEIDYDTNNWLYDASNNTYYYKYPVDPDDSTTDLLEDGASVTLKSKPITDATNIDYVYNQVLDVFAEAIQADPTEAVTVAWGVTVDSNGTITDVN